ncbi:MAG: PEP-CTERM sorting domain-containing protein [Sedimenticola sp.]
MTYLKKFNVLVAIFGLFIFGNANAVVIDFDDLADGTSLTTQYSSLGAVFTGFEDSREIAPEVRNQEYISVPQSSPNYLTNFFNYPSTSTSDRLDEIRISFLAPASDISFYLNTASTNTITVDIFAFDGSLIQTVGLTGSGTDNVFHSLTDTNVGRISMYQPSDGWWWSMDTLSYEIADIPEPATLALMGLGLAGIGWKRRKAA